MVASAKPIRPLTVDEFMLRGPDEPRAELIDGEIVVSPEATPLHQRIQKRMIRVLEPVAEERGLGEWFPPLNLMLSRHNLLIPDLVFVAPGSVVDLRNPLLGPSPLIVVEILSPSSRGNDLVKKRSKYADIGIPEYWIVDPAIGELIVNVRNDIGDYVEFLAISDRIPAGIFKDVPFDRSWVFSDTPT